jgi:hypothetical protein
MSDPIKLLTLDWTTEDGVLHYTDGSSQPPLEAHLDRPQGSYTVLLGVGPLVENPGPDGGGTVPTKICYSNDDCTTDPCYDGPPPPPPSKSRSKTVEGAPDPVLMFLVVRTRVEPTTGSTIALADGFGPLGVLKATDTASVQSTRAALRTWVQGLGAAINSHYAFNVYKVTSVEGVRVCEIGDCIAIPIVIPPKPPADDGAGQPPT